MNTKAMVTLAIGTHLEYLSISLPSLQAFTKRHGYDLYVSRETEGVRYPAWYKIPLLIDMLGSYDTAVFIGSDLVVVDGREDFAPLVPEDAWQAMVRHNTGDGDVPNDDMWLCRRPMLPYLEKIWTMTQWLNHGWWEQAALLELMGYHVIQPTHLEQATELYEHTFFLPVEWNVHKWHNPKPERPRIQHATMYRDRAGVMREWAQEAQGWINELH